MGLMKKASDILEHGSIGDRYIAALFILRSSGRQNFDYFVSRYGLARKKLESLYFAS